VLSYVKIQKKGEHKKRGGGFMACHFYFFGFVVSVFRGAGGGEVSGGGTLYMKWGADNKLSQARFTGRESIL
jgi:hypothetical protein